jgi:predicted dehydrogenase
MDTPSDLSRRRFIKQSSLALAGAAALKQAPFVLTTRAVADDPIRIGVIGCGGRGTGAAFNVLQAATQVIYPQAGYHTEDAAPNARAAADNIQVAALADLFPDRLAGCRAELTKLGIQLPDEVCFTGFDAYKQLLALDTVNYVILATPPHFRPMHLAAAVAAGKHVFMEKPVAVDGPGVRLVLDAGERARQKGLGIAAGTQRRHDPGYQETIKRLHEGAVGEIHTGRAYWNGGVIWVVEREPGWSDMEWQIRNWNYFTWLSGDHIVEQHVHNLDVINWVLDAHPLRARALGGRQARFGEHYGHVYDHFAVEYEYPGGVRMFSQSRQIDGCEDKVEEAVEGSRGTSNCKDSIFTPDGAVAWRYRDKNAPNPYEQEHLNLINSIRAGTPLNEARAIAESTLTGIMGRESAYSGRSITWDEALNSTMDLSPDTYAFGPMPFPDVPVPGRHKFS